MFTRCVKFQDGTVANTHKVVEVSHRLDGATYISIDSDGVIHTLEHGLDEALTIAQAEEWVKDQAEYVEYADNAQAALDEVLVLLTDEQAVDVPHVFPEWKPDVDFKIGYRTQDGGVLYKCLQDHKSQEGWEPSRAPSLWAKVLGGEGEIPVWSQPDATNPFMKGDKVRYPDAESPVYESTIDNNVWSPADYPQGWQLVEGSE